MITVKDICKLKAMWTALPARTATFKDQTCYRVVREETQIDLAARIDARALNHAFEMADIDCLVSASAVGVSPFLVQQLYP